MRIRLLRSGKFLTGGARYEGFLLEGLKKEFLNGPVEVITDKKVFGMITYQIQGLFLFIKGWLNSNADANIVTAKIALSSITRNLLTKNKTIIVLHNYDNNENKRLGLRNYFLILFSILKANPPRVCIVCVSPFFLDFFKKEFVNLPIYHIPNLFPVENYKIKVDQKDQKKILLGQYSLKNDNSVYVLAKLLTKAGYHSFFLTLNPNEASVKEDFEIKYVPFEEYLMEMATSYCSVAFTGEAEGWNRMAHESILVGTPVIGYARGGLGDLLRESDSYIVNTAEEAFDLIVNGKVVFKKNEAFIEKYDASNSKRYLDPLMKFILS